MTILTNGGPWNFKKEADLKLLPMKVHFDQESLATFFSCHEVKNLPEIRITVDTAVEDSINVCIEEKEEVHKIRPCEAGLNYLEVENIINHCHKCNLTIISETITAYYFVQSTTSNKECLTRNEVNCTDNTRCYQ